MSSWGVFLKTCVLLIFFISVVEVKTESTTSKSLSSSTRYYYLDNNSQCSKYGVSKYFNSFGDTAYVYAWRYSSSRYPLGSSCYITFSSYGAYGMKYKFASKSNYIGSGGAELNIYASSSNFGSKLATYTSYSSLPTSYQHTDSLYITIELENYQRSTNFDFELIVKNYDDLDHYTSTGEIVGLTVGSVVFFIILCVLIAVVRRRRRLRILRGDVLITSSGSSSNYNYPTGPVPYPQPSYGSVTTTTTSNYPPPPSYPGPPPAGSTGYSQPPPPVNYPPAPPK